MTQQNFRRLIHCVLLVGLLTALNVAASAQANKSWPSDMKPGSVLFFNRYTSNPSNPQQGDTQINITNVSRTLDSSIHLFFVDGSTCSIADGFISLTPNQTASLLLSDLDPGIQGYLVAVAVGGGGGGPTQFNYLIGNEYIRETDGRTGFLQAVSVAKLSAGDVEGVDGTAQLQFNNVDYECLPTEVALSSFNSQTQDATNLAIYSPSNNLQIGNVETVNVFTLLYNDAEVSLSSSFSIRCYRYESLTSLFNRGGGINRHVPAGRTGWIRMNASGKPLLGSIISRGPVFTGAHNLHAVTLLPSYTITVPAF